MMITPPLLSMILQSSQILVIFLIHIIDTMRDEWLQQPHTCIHSYNTFTIVKLKSAKESVVVSKHKNYNEASKLAGGYTV